MKNILLSTLVALVVSLLCIAGSHYFLNTGSPKVAYVKADQLFNDFELTKELKVKYSNVENARNAILDSLALNLKVIGNKNSPVFQQIEREYYIKKESFDNENATLTETYNQQIWTRINQYVSDFSKEKGYDIVLGANGSGSLFYANDKLDITKDVMEYMNTKYAGSK